MERMQIQLPTWLYERAKLVAQDREVSLAELVRRGLEALLDQYPDPHARKTPWQFPTAMVGKTLVPLEQLYQYAADDEGLRGMAAEDSEP